MWKCFHTHVLCLCVEVWCLPWGTEHTGGWHTREILRHEEEFIEPRWNLINLHSHNISTPLRVCVCTHGSNASQFTPRSYSDLSSNLSLSLIWYHSKFNCFVDFSIHNTTCTMSVFCEMPHTLACGVRPLNFILLPCAVHMVAQIWINTHLYVC